MFKNVNGSKSQSLSRVIMLLLIGLLVFPLIVIPSNSAEAASAAPKLVNVNNNVMDFGTGDLSTGTAKTAGAVYKFTNVITVDNISVDALVTIQEKDSTATLGEFDMYYADSATNKRLNPTIATSGSGGKAAFKVDFVNHADNTEAILLKNFYVTIVDLDGNSDTQKEYAEISGFESYTLSGSTMLTVGAGSDGRTRFTGRPSSLNDVSFDNTASVIANYTAPISTLTVVLGNIGAISTARQFSVNFGAAGGNLSSPNTVQNPNASTISVSIGDGDDGKLTSEDDVDNIIISGTSNAGTGRQVIVNIIDSASKSLTYQATLTEDGAYSVSTDLTSFANGTLTVTASVTNASGNPTSITDTTLKSVFLVSFNSNGGNLVESQLIDINGKATEPAIQTRDAYVFDGWYTDPNFNQLYDFDSLVTTGITLYAKWTKTGIDVDDLQLTDTTDSGTKLDMITNSGNPVATFEGETGLTITLEGPNGSTLTQGQHYNVTFSDGTYTITLLDANLTTDGSQPYGTYHNGLATNNSTSTEDGTYTVNAKDSLNNEVEIGTFVIDTTVPATIPTVVSQSTKDTTPTITGTATVGTDETLMVTVNNVSYTVAEHLTLNGTSWSLTIPSSSELIDGNYPVTATVKDAAGNSTNDATTNELGIITSFAHSAFDLTDDTDSGTIGDKITNNGNPAVTFQGDANLMITLVGPGNTALTEGQHYSVTYSNDTYTITLLDANSTTNGSQPYGTYAEGEATNNSASTSDGTYTVKAEDSLGNIATIGTFVIDTTAPATPTVVSQTTNDTTPTITGTATVGTDETLTVMVEDSLYKVSNYLIVNGTSWSVTTPSALIDGTYPVTATVKDAAGNITKDATTDELVIVTSFTHSAFDLTDGTDSGTNGDKITNNGNPAATFEGQSGLTITLEGPNNSVLTEGQDKHYNVTYSNDTYTITLIDANLTTDGSQPYGTYADGEATNNPASTSDGTYTVKAEDSLGNIATIGTFVIDTTAPATPTVVSQTTNDSTPTITGTATVGTGETLTVTVSGATYTVAEHLTLNGSSWSLTIPNALIDGTYPVTATVTDTAGNSTNDATTNELVIITSFTHSAFDLTNGTDSGTKHDKITNHGKPVATFQGEADLTISLVGANSSLLNQGQHYSVSYSNGTYTITLIDADLTTGGDQPYGTNTNGVATNNSPNTSDGTYTVKAEDTLGNIATIGTFVIDTTLPIVPTVVSQTTNDTTPTITGTATVGTDEALTVIVNNASYTVAEHLTLNGSNWSLEIPNALPYNTYPITASVTDAAGNSSTDATTDELTVKSVDQDVNDAARDLYIRYQPSDIWESVTLPIFLLKDGKHDTDVSWTSSKTGIISIQETADFHPGGPNDKEEFEAIVNRSNLLEDASVILTATVKKGNATKERTFLIIVKSSVITDKTTSPRDTSNTVIVGDQEVNVEINRSVISNGKIVDKLIIDDSPAMDSLIAASSATSTPNLVRLEFSDTPAGGTKADYIAMDVNFSALEQLGGTNKTLHLSTPEGSFVLPPATVDAMINDGIDLNFYIVPIRDNTEAQTTFDRVKQDSAMTISLGNKNALMLDIPRKIETNYTGAGFETQIILPLTAITIPTNATERQQFLDSLRIFIEHSDGTKRVVRTDVANDGEIVYDNGEPVGIKFTVDKFSTFSLFRVVNNTSGSSGSDVVIPPITNVPSNVIDVVSWDLLPSRDELEVELTKKPGALNIDDFTVSVGGTEVSITKIEVVKGNSILILLAKPVREGYRIIIQHEGTPSFKLEILNGKVFVKYINGYPDGEFKPGRSITRAEVAALLARLSPVGGKSTFTSPPYSDLTATNWATGYIETVNKLGLMKGYGEGKFLPEKSITRAEMAVVIVRLLNLKAANSNDEDAYVDTQGHWAEKSIMLLKDKGIMVGGMDGMFHPERNITRAEAVTALNKAVNRLILTGDFSHSWSDVLDNYWAYGHIEKSSRTHEATQISDTEDLLIKHLP